MIENIQALVANVLQPLRDMVGRPINISSGYRSLELNHAIGGSENSQHIRGEAADIECFGVSNYALARMIIDHFSVDQLILEFHNPEEGPNSGWVHVSSKRNGDDREEALRSFRTEDGVRYERLR